MKFIPRIDKITKTTSSLYKNFSKALFSSQETIMSDNKVVRKPRYDGRSKKRQWEERRSDKGEGLNPTLPKLIKTDVLKSDASINPSDRIKRRKFVLLLGYSGAEYFGMQRNPNTKTIEEELFKALYDAEFINEHCFTQVQNMQFQRAARTDKGVSAARQVVSLKLGENFEISKVNERLPEIIRLFAFKRVTKGFNAKSQCDGRTYIYVTPTIVFADQNEEISQKDYRVSEEKLNEINDLLQMYVGTKNFHNFTAKKKFSDPSAKRFIKSFTCEKPFIRNDVEFCVLKVFGQSFMLHQIRKMLGLVFAVIRGMTTADTISKALTDEKVNIPRAPGLGLVLDYVHYERYNFRYGSDGVHEQLIWEEVDKDVEEFKEKHIYPTIIDQETQNEVMVSWIKNRLSRHSYDDIEEKDESDDENGGDDDADDQEIPEEKSEEKEESKMKLEA